MTALAFAWFAREAVDLAVVEVGLGGRLDATHAWDGGVAAITNVDLDHTEWLGPTVPAIAREKAAIIVRGDRAVTGATGEALARASGRARRRRGRRPRRGGAGARAGDGPRRARSSTCRGLGATRVGPAGAAPGGERRRRGRGARRARGGGDRRACRRPPGGPATPPPAGPGASSCSTCPGPGPAAPTPRCSSTAPTTRPARRPSRPRSTSCGRCLRGGDGRAAGARRRSSSAIMGDKDVDGVLRPLAAAPSLAGARVVATAVEGPRALPADGPGGALGGRGRHAVPARSRSSRIPRPPSRPPSPRAEGPVVVAGSLYLVGAARALARRRPRAARPGVGSRRDGRPDHPPRRPASPRRPRPARRARRRGARPGAAAAAPRRRRSPARPAPASGLPGTPAPLVDRPADVRLGDAAPS